MSNSAFSLVLALALIPATAGAQLPPEQQPDLLIDAGTPDRVLGALAGFLSESYVFPDKAPTIEKAIRAHLHTGEYAGIRSAQALLDRVTPQLRDASHDRHLRLVYSFAPLATPHEEEETPAAHAARVAEDAAVNFGFNRVERLDGNIGYIDLRFFAGPVDAGSVAIAAMAFVAHTHALIFDLRQNHGGDPAMVALLLSYVFGPDPVHLNDIYWRPDNSTGQYWTQSYVVGERYKGDVYVLTSANTFSAGEEFAYDLQTRKRATIVGESTGGGAHPITIHRIDDHFMALIPSGRAINPVTHTDWEGVGVKPDVAVSAARALKTAQLAALEKLHASSDVIAATRKELDATSP